MSPLGCIAFTLLFSLVRAQSYEYYYYPTWPIYTAVILVFSIIVSIIGACCRRRAILQRQQRLQAALAAQQQATVHYPSGAYPAGMYPPGAYPPPPGAYPSSAPPGSYPTAMPGGGPTSSLPPYPVAGAMPMDGYANMSYAQTADQDMFKPPPYSQITPDFPEHSKPVGFSSAGPVSHVDVPPPAYDQAAIPPAQAATSSQSPATAPPTVPQRTQQPPQQPPQQRQF